MITTSIYLVNEWKEESGKLKAILDGSRLFQQVNGCWILCFFLLSLFPRRNFNQSGDYE